MQNINEVWESFSSLPDEKKNIVIDLIFKLKESSQMRNQRMEIDNRRKEIKQGKSLSHNEFWNNV